MVCGSAKLALPRNCSTPAWFSASRMRACSRPVTRPRRPMSSGTVTVPERRTSMPWASRLRACWMARAVSRSAFDGIVPVFADAPPGTASFSTSATLLPPEAAATAPFSPAGPEPMTTTS
jgi:hypothetical protein